MEWIIGIVVLWFIFSFFKPTRCDVCSNRFKRKYYTWKIEGKKQHLCPSCNSKMSNRVSAKKFKDRFG
ncbi:hypothetical protein CRN84_18510 [Budvicia aquatica]|uniref:Uncharacterized protein n=1 Tax=Budvicia aquatica TaxID=82979 RepID=A0A2C6DLI6_9GAMM|nr:hypothetical protein CRN84_18510 [Budvicia aquatica]